MSPEDLLPASAAVLMYLDPATGSMLLQMIAAGFAGAYLFLKMRGQRILMIFRSSDDDDDDEGATEAVSDDEGVDESGDNDGDGDE